MLRPAVGLEACVVQRPDEWAGRVEIVRSLPAMRAFPRHYSADFGICWKYDAGAHGVIADGRATPYPRDSVSIRAPGCVWGCDATTASFASIDVSDELIPEGLRFESMTFVSSAALPSFAELACSLVAPTRLARDTALASLWSRLASRELTPPGELRAGASPAAVERARAALEAHHAESLGLDELARRAGANKFGLLRAFQRRYGVTPHAMQVMLRVETARQLLAKGTPIALAAASAGFADQSHLGRHFRRALGITPGAYQAGVQA